jgi:hypothetical protein
MVELMTETPRARIELSETTSIAARFLVATWRSPIGPPSLDEDGDGLALMIGGLPAFAQAIQALRLAESHGGGLGSSALALRLVLEKARDEGLPS